MATAQWILDARAAKANKKKQDEEHDRIREMSRKQRRAYFRSKRNANPQARKAGKNRR